MQVKPQSEHDWLHQLVGEWTFESECEMGPDQPPQKFQGKETVRSLGGVWVICDGEGEMPGGGIGQMIMTLGYDPVKQRFVGTFIGSMMTNLWVYDGKLDGSRKILTLDSKGPSFTDSTQLVDYQDIIEVISPNERTLSSQTPGENGQWIRFMTARYRRKA